MAAKAHDLLFSPVQVGPITLEHRIVMAPMTRQRSQQPGNVPGDLQLQYYTQRASDGGLIIAEGTAVSPLGHGGYGSPGLWTDDQVSGWTQRTHVSYCVSTPSLYLIRPDGYVGFRCHAGDEAKLVNYLQRRYSIVAST